MTLISHGYTQGWARTQRFISQNLLCGFCQRTISGYLGRGSKSPEKRKSSIAIQHTFQQESPIASTMTRPRTNSITPETPRDVAYLNLTQGGNGEFCRRVCGIIRFTDWAPPHRSFFFGSRRRRHLRPEVPGVGGGDALLRVNLRVLSALRAKNRGNPHLGDTPGRGAQQGHPDHTR